MSDQGGCRHLQEIITSTAAALPTSKNLVALKVTDTARALPFHLIVVNLETFRMSERFLRRVSLILRYVPHHGHLLLVHFCQVVLMGCHALFRPI